MKVREFKATDECSILTALIVSDEVLGRVYAQLSEDKQPFDSKWSNTICRWCFNHFQKYKKAPRKAVKELFARHAQKTGDSESLQLIETYLETLSENYEGQAKELNVEFMIDLASHYFERVRLRRYTEKIQDALDTQDLNEARLRQAEFKSLDFSSTAWTNPFDKQTIGETLSGKEREESVIQFSGALGQFLSPHFERNSFLAFAGPEKRGKSFWLAECVYQALRQGRRVLHYSFGDMSQDQVCQRLYSRATKRPRIDMRLKIPVSIKKPPRTEKQGQADVTIKEIQRRSFTAKDIWKCVELLRFRTASKHLRLKLRCQAGDTMMASDIERDIEAFVKDGWMPEVIVIDYADELLAEPDVRRLDFRHQVNKSWRILRRISLDHHCLVITATQAAARGYDAWVLRKKDFSEDKRKNAHVTGLIGINQTSEEKQFGIYRLNWVALRDGKWSDSQVIWTAGNLAVANPCMVSTL